MILSVLGLEGELSGVEQGAWGAAGVEEEEDEEGGGREAQRRSLSTVSCSVVQGRASVERAKLWGTLLMSTLLTWSGKHVHVLEASLSKLRYLAQIKAHL